MGSTFRESKEYRENLWKNWTSTKISNSPPGLKKQAAGLIDQESIVKEESEEKNTLSSPFHLVNQIILLQVLRLEVRKFILRKLPTWRQQMMV